MAEILNPEDLGRVEWRILCLLCQNPAARIELANSLHDYRWSDLVCRVIYQIVCSSPQISPEQLRSQLPTRLTNAGFPDFAWEGLFLPNTCSVQEAETLLRELQAPPSS